MYDPPCPWRLRCDIKAEVAVPVIAVARFMIPRSESGSSPKGDRFVSLGRALITDSHFAKKIELNQVRNIRKCIECNQLCVDSLLVYDQPVSCIYNVRAGKELDSPLLRPAAAAKWSLSAAAGRVGGCRVARSGPSRHSL